MKNIIKCTWIFLLMLISQHCRAQDYNIYLSTTAIMLHVNDDIRTESRLEKVILSLSNNNQLTVRLNIPRHSIDYVQAENTLLLSQGLLFDLEMNINPWKAQDYLTSTSLFTTQGLLSLNNITRAVKVEYI